MNSDFQTVVFCCFDDAGVDVVLVCLNMFDMLFQEPTSNACLKREPSSQESFGMARVELGAEDQGSQKLIQ